jgi:tetratricopeptide (TPR) repeat protein
MSKKIFLFPVIFAFFIALSSSCIPSNGQLTGDSMRGEKESKENIEQGATVQALPEEGKAVEEDPRDKQIRNLLAKAEENRSDLLSEMDFLEMSYVSLKRDENGDNIQKTVRFPMFKDAGLMLDTRKIYEKILDMDPGNIQALLGSANLDLMQAMTDISLMQRQNVILVLDPPGEKEFKKMEKEKILLQKEADIYLGSAKTKFLSVLTANQGNPSAHLGLGIVYMLQKDWNSAKEKFEFIEKNNLVVPRGRSVFYVWYGVLFEQLENRDTAIELYQKAAFYQEPFGFSQWAKRRIEDLFLQP